MYGLLENPYISLQTLKFLNGCTLYLNQFQKPFYTVSVSLQSCTQRIFLSGIKICFLPQEIINFANCMRYLQTVSSYKQNDIVNSYWGSVSLNRPRLYLSWFSEWWKASVKFYNPWVVDTGCDVFLRLIWHSDGAIRCDGYIYVSRFFSCRLWANG